MITEVFALRLAGITAGVAALGTSIGTSEMSHVLRSEMTIEITIVLWAIGGLLSMIALLLAVICYFIKDMRNSNHEQHSALFDKSVDLNERLSNLEGSHASSYNVKGCAYDDKKMIRLIHATVESIIDNGSQS